MGEGPETKRLTNLEVPIRAGSGCPRSPAMSQPAVCSNWLRAPPTAGPVAYTSILISMRGGPITPALAMASFKSGSLAKA